MAKQNFFKNFIPFELNMPAFKAFKSYAEDGVFDALESCLATDPTGGQWSRIGLVEPMPADSLIMDLDGSAYLMAVQINERILPAKVRDEAVQKKADRLVESMGRKLGKKEYAELRDEVEIELLPKAFIKRTKIMVALREQNDTPFMLVFTSSMKKAEAVFLMIKHALCDQPAAPVHVELRAFPIQMSGNVTEVLTTLAIDGVSNSDDRQGLLLHTDKNIVIKSIEDKRTFRIKDRTVEAHDVQSLLNQEGYKAVELGLTHGSEEDEKMFCTVSDKLIFKGCTIPEKLREEDQSDLFANSFMAVRTYMNFLQLFAAECGGFVHPNFNADEQESDQAEEPQSTEDDDEL